MDVCVLLKATPMADCGFDVVTPMPSYMHMHCRLHASHSDHALLILLYVLLIRTDHLLTHTASVLYARALWKRMFHR